MSVRHVRAVMLMFIVVPSTCGFAQQDRVVVKKDVSQDRESIAQPNADAVPHINRGNERFEQGEYERAIEDYSTAIRVAPDSAIAFRKRGESFVMTGKYPEAIADFNRSIQIDPSEAETYFDRGNAWSDQREFKKAIADFSEAIRLNPSDVDSYFNRGNAWSEIGALDEAIADYTEAIRLDSSDARSYINRGNAWTNQGEYDKAIADQSEAIRLDPEQALPYLNRGAAWSKIGDHDHAIADFSTAIRLDPTDAMSYYNRGLTWHFMRQPEKAKADFEEAVRLDPNFAEHVKQWSVASAEQEKEFAEVSLEQALSVPAEALAQGYLAVKYTSELATYVAEDGWQLQTSLDGHPMTLTKENVGSYLPSLRQRLAIYEQAIQERGYLDLPGPYVARIRAACEQLGIRSGPTLIEQKGFRLTLTQSGIVYRGVIVESSLVLEDIMNTEIALVGRATRDAITLDVQFQGFTAETESSDCQVVLRKSDRTDHSFSAVFVIRALDTLLNQEETGPALQYLSEAIRLDATFPVAYAVRSQILSSVPDAKYRNGELALCDAERACELTEWKQWPYLRTLASAHAENGDYETAIRWIREALKLAPPMYHEELRDARDLFKQRKPLRLDSDSIDIYSPFFEASADAGRAMANGSR